MHNFKKISDKIVYAEMFAFHFAKDKDITIECDVRICSAMDKSTKCFLKTVGVSIMYITYDIQYTLFMAMTEYSTDTICRCKIYRSRTLWSIMSMSCALTWIIVLE